MLTRRSVLTGSLALAGAAAKDNADDLKKLRRYIEHRAARRKGEHWAAFVAARHALPQ